MKHTSSTSFSVACLFSEPTNNLCSTAPNMQGESQDGKHSNIYNVKIKREESKRMRNHNLGVSSSNHFCVQNIPIGYIKMVKLLLCHKA